MESLNDDTVSSHMTTLGTDLLWKQVMLSLAELKKTLVTIPVPLRLEGMDEPREEYNGDKQDKIVMLETVQ